MIKNGWIDVDGAIQTDAGSQVMPGQQVCLDGEPLAQPGPRYFMLNKPQGYVSVTKDANHPTVLELIEEPNLDKLQIAGRLDIDTTGLLLITDDGQWNHAITSPRKSCNKVYHVTLAEDISNETAPRFSEGILLDGELKPTLPATLDVIYANEARLTIQEGKYHQVKRMFAAVGNRVVELHRERVGDIVLDPDLAEGDYRPLTEAEISSVQP